MNKTSIKLQVLTIAKLYATQLHKPVRSFADE